MSAPAQASRSGRGLREVDELEVVLVRMSVFLAVLVVALTAMVSRASAIEGFDPEISGKLEARILQGPGVAVFDGDKTLWREDVGEGFFEWLCHGRKLKDMLPGEDPMQEYASRCDRDLTAGYAWAVTRMAGLREADVRRWAEAYFRVMFEKRIFEPQRALIRFLQQHGWEVWIVSASNRWVVQAGARWLGVPREHVVGVDLEIVDGLLTGKLAYPMTHRAGKVLAIDRFIKRRPDLVSGDSEGDREMMLYSRGLSLLITDPSRKSQKDMRDLARKRGWLMQILK